MGAILEIKGITKYFGRICAVDSLSFSVNRGEVFGILGPNGSGKTTTLAIVMGLVNPLKGTYSWFGGDIPSDVSRKKIGTLIEVPYFYPYLTLTDNLKIIARIRDISFDDIDRVLKTVNLYHRKNSKYRTLSLGMQQRIAIASVLLGDPEVLVLDEPTNGLDPKGIADIRDIIISEREKGKTIIMASHILAEVEKVCTNVAVLKEGKLLAESPVSELPGNELKLLLSSEDNERLQEELSRSGIVKTAILDGDHVMATLNEGITPLQVNRYLVQQGIVVSRLEEKKSTLESQFLELVK